VPPFHYTKSFAAFATDYGMQEGSGLTGLIESVVPVALVDDASMLAYRTYPTYISYVNQAAVAVLSALAGINNPPGSGVLLEVLNVSAIDAGQDLYIVLSEADLVTANGGAPTVTSGFTRGQTGTRALLRTGTTAVAVAAAGGMWFMDDSANTQFPPLQGHPLVMRPGEFLWVYSSVVNVGIFASFLWRELTVQVPPNPPVIP